MANPIAELLVRIGADVSGLQRGLQEADGSIQGVAKGFGIAGAALTAGVTVPLTAIGTAAARAATDFDREMRNIQSISKASDAEIAALGKTFLAMSQDTRVTTDSATALAQGFYQIQSSGFAGADAMTVLRASTQAASAGLTDTETAAKAILATLNAYGMSADQAAHVSDVLFKTVDIGVLSFEELATNVGDIVGTANAAGVGIEQLGAAMATLTKGGISAAESSTALNQLMLAFISPSKEAAKAAAQLGIDFNASMLKSKGLHGALMELVQATGGVTLVSEIERNERLRGIAAQIAELQERKKATGITKEQKEAISEQIAELKKQKKEIGNAIFENLDYADSLEKMAASSGLSVEALAALFPNVRALKAALALAREEGNVFASDLETIGGAAGATAAAFEIQTKSFDAQMKTFNNTVEALKIGLGSVLMPILIELGQAIMPLITKFGELSPTMQKVIVIGGMIAAALGPVLMVIGGIISAVGTISGVIGPVVAAIGAVLGTIAGPILLVIGVIALLYAAWKNNWFGIRDTVMEILPRVGAFLATAWETIKATAISIWTAISEWFTTAWTNIKTTATAIWTGIQTAFTTIMTAIQTTITTIWTAISGFFTSTWTAISETATTIWTAISGFFTSTWTAISETATAVWTAISGFFTTITTAIQTTITTIWTAIRTTVTAIWTAISTAASAIWEGIKLAIETIITALAGVIRAIMQALQGDFAGAWETMKATAVSVVGNLRDGVLGILTGLVNGVYEAGVALATRFGEGIRSALERALDAARAIADRIRALLPGSDAETGPLSDLFASGRALATTLGAGISAGQAAAVGAAEALARALAPVGVGVPAGLGAPALGSARGAASVAPGQDDRVVGGRGGQVVNVTINNPQGEPTERSVVRALKNLAALGVLEPVAV